MNNTIDKLDRYSLARGDSMVPWARCEGMAAEIHVGDERVVLSPAEAREAGVFLLGAAATKAEQGSNAPRYSTREVRLMIADYQIGRTMPPSDDMLRSIAKHLDDADAWQKLLGGSSNG